MATKAETRQKATRVTALIIAFVAINFLLAATPAVPEEDIEPPVDDALVLSSRSISPTQKPDVHEGLASSSLPELKKLGEYEKRLGYGQDELMYFVDVPANENEAKSAAKEVARALREFGKFNIRPLVLFQPNDTDLRNINLEALEKFFNQLKLEGVNNGSIGTWAPFPEPNSPKWSVNEDFGNTSPETFQENFTKTAGLLKHVFPAARTAVLLNAASYQSGDTDYEKGPDYQPDTLRRYVNNLNTSLVDEAALKGLPKAPNDFQPEGGWLDSELAEVMARNLATSKIQLLTGTFSKMNGATLSPLARKVILTDISTQARKLKEKGYEVRLNILASNIDGQTNSDWAYSEGEDFDIIKEFTDNSYNRGVKVNVIE